MKFGERLLSLSLAISMTLTTCQESLHFALRLLGSCQSFCLFFGREPFFIVCQTLADQSGLILRSFGLANLTDSALDLPTSLLDQPLSLLLGFGYDATTLFSNALHLLGVLARSLL